MARRLLFDVSRLAWRARRNSPTGIDRVLLAYARWLRGQSRYDVVPVALAGDRLTRMPQGRYEALLDQAATTAPAEDVAHDRAWRDLLEALAGRDGGALRRPVAATPPSDWLPIAADLAARFLHPGADAAAGDLYLNVAHSGLHRPALLSRLKQAGARPVVMVHDLIPITHPEFCAPGAHGRHRQRIDSVLRDAALVIANSASTAAALTRYATQTGARAPTVAVAPLGIEPAFAAPAAPTPGAAPYFVVVGTLEARKNLAFLLMLWRRLVEDLGEAAPHLVMVGRRGWENEAVLDQLERAPGLDRVVHEIADLSDARLARLIGGARALLAPSLAEGFDLPSIEALGMGVPVIASDIDVHRELAVGARLIDALDGPAWLAAIKAACAAAPPRPAFSAPTWQAHFSLVEAALAGLEADDVAPPR
jgi:glycosyltransferase involved in cell wall biosynthesis